MRKTFMLRDSKILTEKLQGKSIGEALMGVLQKGDDILVDAINCPNFKLYEFGKYPLKKRALQLYEDGNIVFYCDTELPLSGYNPIVPAILEKKQTVIVDVTQYVNVREEVSENGSIVKTYKFKNESIFAELMNLAVTVHSVTFNTNPFISNMDCRESIHELYFSALFHVLARMSSIATSPDARHKLKYLAIKYLTIQFDMKWISVKRN